MLTSACIVRQYRTLLPFLLLPFFLAAQNADSNCQQATVFVRDVLDRCHNVSFVYREGNSGCNIFIPYVEGDVAAFSFISQQSILYPPSGLSHGLLTYLPAMSGTKGYTSWRYTYGENNYGTFPGVNLIGATKLTVYLRGKGTLEVAVGGTNRRPFHDSNYSHEDGLDVRSTGYITLKDDEWTPYELNLMDSTFWVYKGPKAGANNKFPVIGIFQDAYDCSEYLHVAYDSTDEKGDDCLAVTWNRPSSAPFNCYGGFGLLSPNIDPTKPWKLDSAQSYNATGLTQVCFKVKATKPGFFEGSINAKGSKGKHVDNFIVDTCWCKFCWDLPQTIPFNSVNLGFGIALIPHKQQLSTPDTITLFFDSIYYVGTYLKTDLAHAITGASLILPKLYNSDTAIVAFENVYYDRPRLDEPRGPQSFLLPNLDSLYWSQFMTVHVYDASLVLTALLAEWYDSHDPAYLDRAKKIGDFFRFAQHNDFKFDDGRLRNVYASGLAYNHLGKVRMPGYWNEAKQRWISDAYDYSTSTGNLAWAAIALLNLYEATKEAHYLHAADSLGAWIIKHTWSTRGFTAGYQEVWDTITGLQQKLLYTATEHCIDLYAMFTRLYEFTEKPVYQDAALHADAFVKSMWNPVQKVFYTGTDTAGLGINTSVIPVDLQAWMPLAYRDTEAYWRGGYDFAKANMLLQSDTFYHFPGKWLVGYDFSLDSNMIIPTPQLPVLDGIWAEGTGQMALVACLYRDTAHYKELLRTLECMQAEGPGKGFGLPAATINGLTTGFSWQYHYILHSGGATCWYLFAKKGVNPYYCARRCLDCAVQPLTASAAVLSPVHCAGDSSGSMIVAAHGGLPPYIYSLDGVNYQTSNTFTGLPAGTFSITVQDNAGSHFIVGPVTLEAPKAIAVTVSVVLNTIIVSASGGTGILEYSRDGNNFQTDSIFTGLPNDTFTVTVRDANGCTAIGTATVNVPPLAAQVTQNHPIVCFSGVTALTITASGGIPPYAYQLDSGAVQSSNVFENLATDEYMITVFDAAGHSIVSVFMVTQPAEIIIDTSTVTGTTITVAATGGTGDIMYSLDGGDFQADGVFHNVTFGNHTVIARDGNGCQVSALVHVSLPPFSINGTSSTNTCPGDSSGTAEVCFTGGVGPYNWNLSPEDGTYTLDTAENCIHFEGMPAGTYKVTLTDGANQTSTASIVIDSFPHVAFLVSNFMFNLIVEVNQGLPPFTYSTDGINFDTINTLPVDSNGTYTIWVKDGAGCIYTKEYVFVQTTDLGQSWGISIRPNPSSGIFEITLTDAPAGPLSVSVFNAAGQYCRGADLGKTGSPVSYTIDMSELAVGVYSCVIRAGAGVLTRRLVLLK